METIAQSNEARPVIGGVDTHKDVHVAAVIDATGRILGSASFPATRHGYRRLLSWMSSCGELASVGVEGCGSWGTRPNRQRRRQRGKSDPADAEAAARAVLAGEATLTPKAGDGPVEALRQLRVARAGAMKARTAAANQLYSLTDTAPNSVRATLRGLSAKKMVALCCRWRPTRTSTPEGASRYALAAVARRWEALDAEIAALDHQIKALLDEAAPKLVAVHGVGYETAGALLVAAGDNPGRLERERSFAALCGSSPVEASSGRTRRHRLNRGGDRQANAALWRIVIVRMATHRPTKDYIARRTAEGLSKKEIIRCLKRYVARELFPLIRAVTKTADHMESDEIAA